MAGRRARLIGGLTLRPARALLAAALIGAAPAVAAQGGPAEEAAERSGERSALAGAAAGQAAFDGGDLARARAIWERAAAAGSAEAALGLGVMADLGLAGPRDPAAALRWYERAGNAGLAEGQFNAGVMRDAGAAGPRAPRVAAGWYARAAAGGHRRAQYNLGLMFGSGDGVARNADLARHWTARAAEVLPAARERLGTLDAAAPGERTLEAPSPLVGALVPGGPGGAPARAELGWSAPPGPEGAPFEVELLAARRPAPDRGPARLGPPPEPTVRRTEGSALHVDLPPAVAPEAVVWRVLRLDQGRGRYAASGWRALSAGSGAASGSGAEGPAGRVRLRLWPGDAGAARLARELTAELAGAGLWGRTEAADAPPEASAVRYAYAQDEALARGVAALLPVLRPGDAALDRALARGGALRPGEVAVTLAGGPGEDGGE